MRVSRCGLCGVPRLEVSYAASAPGAECGLGKLCFLSPEVPAFWGRDLAGELRGGASQGNRDRGMG